MDPEWPPRPLLINGGPSPSLGHLRTPISNELGIPTDKMVIFKFLPQSLEWVELRAGMKSTAAAATAAANTTGTASLRGAKTGTLPIGSSAAKKSDNILEPPYSMKEGDLLCAFAALPVASAAEAAARTYTVSRRLDQSLRKLIEVRKKERRARVKGGPSEAGAMAGATASGSDGAHVAAGGRKKFTQEVILTLGGDLDFSDDDSCNDGT